MTIDVTKAIEAKSDQLNSADLIEPRTIKIKDVQLKQGDQPISIFFEGDDGKPWKPSKTSARCLALIWGANAAQWIGMRCTIYNDPTVTWAGAAVGGIRVSHMEGIDKPVTLMLTKTRGKKGSTVIQPLGSAETAEVNYEAACNSARDAANNGRESFQAWWRENANLRNVVKPIMDELKEIVEEAEAIKNAEPS